MNNLIKKIAEKLNHDNNFKKDLIRKSEVGSEGRELEDLLAEFSSKGYIKCQNYNEYLLVIEFLYLHDSDFSVTNVDSSNSVCTIRRI